MTQMRSHCGCGWHSTRQSKLNTVQQAIQHCEETGHSVEVHGWIKPSPARLKMRNIQDLQRRVANREQHRPRHHSAKAGGL